jgi:hypothetical protein
MCLPGDVSKQAFVRLSYYTLSAVHPKNVWLSQHKRGGCLVHSCLLSIVLDNRGNTRDAMGSVFHLKPHCEGQNFRYPETVAHRVSLNDED